jgi:hypothetical protein
MQNGRIMVWLYVTLSCLLSLKLLASPNLESVKQGDTVRGLVAKKEEIDHILSSRELEWAVDILIKLNTN